MRRTCKHRVGGFAFGPGCFVCWKCGKAIRPERIALLRLMADVERVETNKLRPDASGAESQEFLDLELESCLYALRRAVEVVKAEGPTEPQARALPAAEGMLEEAKE